MIAGRWAARHRHADGHELGSVPSGVIGMDLFPIGLIMSST